MHNFPFLQKNIVDFWRYWHISLVSWSREYIFMDHLPRTPNGKVKRADLRQAFHG